MVVLTDRAKHVLLCLCQERSAVTVGSLARRLGVSPRTVRYDLDLVEAWLWCHGFPLERKPKVGITLPVDGEGFDRISQCLGAMGEYNNVLKPDTRVRLILAALLQRDEPVTTSRLAMDLQISRSTLQLSLVQVERWLATRGLKLVRKPNFGLKALGSEEAWRQASFDIINGLAEDQDPTALLRQLEKTSKDSVTGDWGTIQVLKLVRDVNIEQVQGALRDWETDLGQAVPSLLVPGLATHLAVALSRIKRGRLTSLGAVDLQYLREQKEFEMASLLASKVTRRIGMALPAPEVGYIALRLLGAMPSPAVGTIDHSQKVSGGDDGEALRITKKLIRTASSALGLSLLRDAELLHGLCAHLRNVFTRLRFGLSVENPMLGQVKAAYPRIYSAAQKAGAVLAAETCLKVPDEEIGHIAVHLGAALERIRKSDMFRPRALIVCAAGGGTASLLKSRLLVEFPQLEVKTLTSVSEMEDALGKHRVDFVISTVPFVRAPLPMAHVNPLLPPKDIELIQTLVKRSAPESEDSILEFARLEATKSQEMRKGKPGAGNREAENFVASVEGLTLAADLHCLARTWEQAVRRSGQLLVEVSAVSPGYVDAMVAIIKEWGSYCLVAPGVALPHARSEDGVIRSALSIVRLVQPVRFGHSTNDPVSIVLGMAATSHRAAKRIVVRLVKSLEEGGLGPALNQAGTVQEVLSILKLL